jgi:hypothetical protein
MESHYNELYLAMANNDNALEKEIRDFLTVVKGKDAKEIKSKVKSQLKIRVLDGTVTKDTAIKWLVDKKLEDDQKKAFTTVDGWIEKAGREDDEDDSHSVYDDVLNAIKSGNSKALADAKAELKKNGYKDSEIYTGIRKGIQNWFLGDEITETKAKSMLRTYGNVVDKDGKVDEDEIYWKVEEWKARDVYTGDLDEFSFSKYEDFDKAVGTGSGLKAAIQDLMSHGVTKEALSSRITNQYKDELVALVKAGKTSQAAALQAKILDAYVALGYNRDQKLRDVKKWYTETK